MSYIRELGEKLDKVGKGLDSIQKHTQRVNAKVEALIMEKEEKLKVASLHDSKGSFVDNLSESSGRSSWCSHEAYVDWELKVEQIHSCFNL
ncbi:hypothetical protein CR513_60027, partial [Mucuna pruriens]